MTTVNMLDAKTRLSQLVQAVENGDETEIIIARNGKPAARLVAIGATARKPFQIGLAKGRLQIPEDFDALDAEVAAGMSEAEAEWRELE